MTIRPKDLKTKKESTDSNNVQQVKPEQLMKPFLFTEIAILP